MPEVDPTLPMYVSLRDALATIDHLEIVIEGLQDVLRDANDLLRSAASIAAREGNQTNWVAFQRRAAEVLVRQHRLVYPEEPVVALLWEVRAECDRVVADEGYDRSHDDEHMGGELASAAAAYALASVEGTAHAALLWPWDPDGFKPKDRRRNLIRAMQLLVAETLRVDREDRSFSGVPDPWVKP